VAISPSRPSWDAFEEEGAHDHHEAVARANEKLVGEGKVPLPEGLTPHKFRHTFASILVATGCDPGSVMD
jgi:integrase